MDQNIPKIVQSSKSSKHNPQEPYIQGHILKFIHKGKSPIDKGIICFPQQTYGISQDFPNQFKTKRTLVPKNGYIYRHQNKPQFKYYSQKRYFSIDGSLNPELSQQIHSEEPQNKLKFHRKKGRLSEFIDKNGWMNKTTKIMGFERGDQSRKLSNRDRSLRIAELTPKKKYENKLAIKPIITDDYLRTLATFTSEKMRIRDKRNKQAQRFNSDIQSKQSRSSSRRNEFFIDSENVQNRMLQTMKDWSPSKTSKSMCEQFSKTAYSNRLLKFQNRNKINSALQISQNQQQHENLQKWYRTTCSSKWVYNKKVQSEEEGFLV